MFVSSEVKGTLKDILESHETSLQSKFLLYSTVFTVLILVVYTMIYALWQGNKYIFLSGTQNLLRHAQFLLTNIPLSLIRIPRTQCLCLMLYLVTPSIWTGHREHSSVSRHNFFLFSCHILISPLPWLTAVAFPRSLVKSGSF